MRDMEAKHREGDEIEKAAQNTAYCGRSTRVETMVAIELAASCIPFRKSNRSATAIKPVSSAKCAFHGALA